MAAMSAYINGWFTWLSTFARERITTSKYTTALTTWQFLDLGQVELMMNITFAVRISGQSCHKLDRNHKVNPLALRRSTNAIRAASCNGKKEVALYGIDIVIHCYLAP